ncbi:hypothetical protein [Bradyrhizobium sp. AZCC 2289]|uniref:hypothetical protein n=1 Tax=Bradyrhizobium sp. AZCC 2289 TaxID=3117026 RepID=UPI002FF22907
MARKAGFIEFAPRVDGFAALWHVGNSVTNVAESENFAEILQRAEEWARSEGVPLVRGLQ